MQAEAHFLVSGNYSQRERCGCVFLWAQSAPSGIESDFDSNYH